MTSTVCLLCLFIVFEKLLSAYNVGSAMPMPNYPAAGTTGAYRPPGYQPYPPPYTGGQPSQPAQIPSANTPYPPYQPYPQTTQAYTQPTGKIFCIVFT